MAGGKGKVLQAVINMAGNIDPSLSKSIESVTKKLSGIDMKAVAIGAAAGGIAIATGKAVFEAGKYLVELGGQFDNVADTIRIGTGATGEALDALIADFDEVYKSVPTTMEDASKAVADYNTRLGLTGDELQELSVQAIQATDMLGDDLNSVIEQSSQAFQQWNIDAGDMGEGMDYIFKVSQSTGVGFSDLFAKMQQYGPQLQEMGYSFETASALIGKMEKAGVNTDEVLGAMKKSVASLAKEGIAASDGFAYYYEQIMNAEDATKAATLASEIFGSKAGSTMAAAIRDGTLAVGDFTAELLANNETIGGAAEDTYDFAERLQMFKQNAEIALKPLANTLFDSINKLMPPLTKAMEVLAPAIGEVVEMVIPLVNQLFDNLLPAIEHILPIIMDLAKKLLSKLIPPAMKIITALLPAIMSLLDALMPILDLVIELLGPILDIIADLLAPILDLITTAISPLINVFGQFISEALKPLMPILDVVADLLTNNLGSAIEGIMPVIEALQGYFSGLIDFITNVFAGNWEGAWEAIIKIFSSVWDGIVAIFKFPINMIIEGLNFFLGALNQIKIPDWVPGVGGKGIEIPLIPKLAAGGFTDGISIAGEAGTEAVLSFDPAYRSENLSYWAKAGQMLGVSEEYAGSVMSFGTVVYDLGGIHFSPQIIVHGNTQPEDIVKQLKNVMPEFRDMIEDVIDEIEEGRYENCGAF